MTCALGYNMNELKKMLFIFACLSLATSLPFVRLVNAGDPVHYPGGNCSLRFDGNDDYVSCSSQVYKTRVLTIELWLKPEYTIERGSNMSYGHTIGAIASCTATWGTRGWALYFDFSDGRLYFNYRKASYVYEIVTVGTNREVWNSSSWYHIAFAFSPANIVFYVNKTIDKTFPTDSLSVDYDSSELQVGGYLTSKYMFQGLLDEVRFWNVSRTQSEIIDCWNRTLTPKDREQRGLIGYWRFDEGDGLESRDLSLQGNNAILGLEPFNPEWISRGAPIMRTPFWTDLNDDGFLDILDVFVVANAYGSKQGDPSWNATADLDKNGVVNILDVFAIARDYGKIV
jgi:hypothetical protein